MTNNEFFKIYRSYQEAHMTRRTCQTRCYIIERYLLEEHGEEKPSDITNMDIDSIYHEMEIRNLAQNTVFGTYAALLSFFKMAVELREAEHNPVSLARAIRVER